MLLWALIILCFLATKAKKEILVTWFIYNAKKKTHSYWLLVKHKISLYLIWRGIYWGNPYVVILIIGGVTG